jgi:outer membrane protein
VLVSFRKVFMGSLAASLLAVPAMAEVKVGVVDYARLLEDSPQAKQVQESLRAEFGPRLQQIVAAENALKTKNEKLQKDGATMSPDQRTKAEKELRDGARDLERRKQELQDDSNAKRNDEVGKLQRSLMTEVRDYAKAQNYDIVIAEGVIYATPAVDITPQVLQALQARAPKPASPAGGAPAPAKPAAKP